MIVALLMHTQVSVEGRATKASDVFSFGVVVRVPHHASNRVPLITVFGGASNAQMRHVRVRRILGCAIRGRAKSLDA